MEGTECDDRSMWSYLPYTVLCKIFNYLNYKDVVVAGRVCQFWYQVSLDDLLWKRQFYRNFDVDSDIPVLPDNSWHEEFKRLCFHIPVVQTEVLTDHGNQVLHVSFSHNGKYFATCSKDGYVLLWYSSYPASVVYYRDMKTFSWKYTQYSQFNESDTLLLVSGVHFGTPHSTSGEIAVFNLQNGFELQCRVVNKPYDIFGTWYSDQHLLSGDLLWLAHLVSTSVLWLNKASQETNSEHIPITQHLYKFYNRNASSIRAIMVANCLPNSEIATEDRDAAVVDLPSDVAASTSERGNPLSHHDIHGVPLGGGVAVALDAEFVSQDGGRNALANPIWYSSDYRKVESESTATVVANDSGMGQESDDDSSDDRESGSDSEAIVTNDKYLIFTTGFKTYSPHQIGLKRIKPIHFPKRMDPGPTLKERLALHERKKELLRSSSPPPEPDWLNYEAVAYKFDKVDHLIDIHGHIVGMGLSPDHRYLYVNCRSWPQGYVISNPLDPPPIAQEIDIHVIDLVTLKEVGTMLRAHKAYTPNNECFFIFLDVCDKYVASGAEDKHGYLWDRHYGICLAKFPHADVVNSVAFNPKDPEMLVTTSDDNTIKIWRSRAKVKSLGLNLSEFQNGIEVRKVSNKFSSRACNKSTVLRQSRINFSS